jgi:hypothetical protein
MKNIKLIFLFFLISCIPLYPDWEPDCLGLNDTAALEILKSPDLNDLKSHVLQYLQNSWCTKGKANLLIDLVVLTSPEVCVEIGSFTGSTALPILASLQYCGKGNLYAIDAWSPEEAIRGLPPSDVNTQWWGMLDMVSIKAQFYEMLNSWSLNKYCRVMPMTSQSAVGKLPSIDFLHLDGNFSEEGAFLDSKLYVTKVKSGGYILLSNVHIMIAKRPSKMKALTVLLDHCEVICEIDNGQTLLFRKW